MTLKQVKNEENTDIVNEKKTPISNANNLRDQQRLKQSSKRRRLERRVQTLSDAWRWRQQRCLSADEADCSRHQVQTPRTNADRIQRVHVECCSLRFSPNVGGHGLVDGDWSASDLVLCRQVRIRELQKLHVLRFVKHPRTPYCMFSILFLHNV